MVIIIMKFSIIDITMKPAGSPDAAVEEGLQMILLAPAGQGEPSEIFKNKKYLENIQIFGKFVARALLPPCVVVPGVKECER